MTPRHRPSHLTSTGTGRHLRPALYLAWMRCARTTGLIPHPLANRRRIISGPSPVRQSRKNARGIAVPESTDQLNTRLTIF